MPRTLDPILTAALEGGSFEAIIKIIHHSSSGEVDCKVIYYKQEFAHLVADFYLPYEGLPADDVVIKLVRGVRVTGTDYTVTSAWYYPTVCTQQKKLVHFEGDIAPIKPDPTNTDSIYSEVISNFLDNSQYSASPTPTLAYYDASAAWLDYTFDTEPLTRVRSLDTFLATLKQKRFIYAADDQDGYVIFTAAGDDTFAPGAPVKHTLTANLLDTVSNQETSINYLWHDETGARFVGADPTAVCQHDLGFLKNGELPPLSASCPSRIRVQLPIHLKYLTGDKTTFTLPDTSTVTAPIQVTEIFDIKHSPAWYLVIEPIPYARPEIGPDTTSFNAGTTVISWSVQVDWTESGAWASAAETNAIHDVKYSRGRRARMRANSLAQPDTETCTIKLLDNAQRFDRFNTSSPLHDYLDASRLPIRLLMTKAGVTTPVFTGVLDNIQYVASTSTVILTCSGLAKYLQTGIAKVLSTPCQPVTGGHDSYFVADGSTPFPVNYWRGRPGGLTLAEITNMTLTKIAWPFPTYHGDYITNYEQPDYFYYTGASAWQTMKEVADGFAARLFFLRDGCIYIMDRADLIGVDPGVTFPAGVLANYGIKRLDPANGLRNKVTVQVRPHTCAPFKTPYLESYYLEAWSNAGPLEIAPSTTLEIDIKYRGGTGTGGVGSFVEVNGSGYPTNYECWSAADRTGTRMDASGSGQGEFAIIWDTSGGLQKPYGNNEQYCRVKFRNYSTTLTAYFFNCKVMLIGIREPGQPILLQLEDATSLALNGPQELTLSSRIIQTTGMGDAIGTHYLNKFSARENAALLSMTYRWITYDLWNNLLAYDIGAHVQFGETANPANLGMTGRWLIVGQELNWISADGQQAQVELLYEKADDVVNVVHDRSSSGNTGATPASSITVSTQVSSRPTRMLIALVSVRAYQSVVSITRDGQSFTKLDAIQTAAGNNPRAEVWYLANPNVNTSNTVMTLTGADFAELVVIGLYNVNPHTPLTAFKSSGNSTTPSTTAFCKDTDFMLDLLAYSGTTATVGAGQTAIGTVTSDGNWKLSTSKRLGDAPSVPMAWSVPSAVPWAHIAIAIKAASG